MAKYCLQCGAELKDEALFCFQCGAKTRKKMGEAGGKVFFDMGDLGLKGAAGQDVKDMIFSPGQTFGTLFSRIGSGLRIIRQKPASVIPAVVLCVIWIILLNARRRGTGNLITGLLSFVSYGGDASQRPLLGVCGTAVGRGAVALAFSSLFIRGRQDFRNGLSAIFSKTGNAPAHSAPGWLITGLGASFLVSRLLEGTPFFSRIMVVVSLAVISAQALGNKKNWLYAMARSITASVRPDRTRAAEPGSLRAMMTGLFAGFAFMTAFSAGNSLINMISKDADLSSLPALAGVVLILLGSIMNASGRKKAKNT